MVIYFDNAATSLYKPSSVSYAMMHAMEHCANPGRGGYSAAMAAADTVFHCRASAAELFHCSPEQVVFTSNCTQGLNMAITTLVKPGDRVLISGFEHNAVTRPLHALGAKLVVAGDRLFDWENTLDRFEQGLRQGVDAAVFTHVSNVFGYILPVEQIAKLCKQYGTPFVVDAAQSAGVENIDLTGWDADFVAMPGHKGLLGPQGTGMLLCGRLPEPLIHGGTGSQSLLQQMPDFLPDRGEAGTLNVPGIAGLDAGLTYIRKIGVESIRLREQHMAKRCAEGLKTLGFRVFSGEHQSGVVSFVPPGDCQAAADYLAGQGIAVRAGLHCAPLAHETAGTLETGTVRLSFGYGSDVRQIPIFLQKTRGLA